MATLANGDVLKVRSCCTQLNQNAFNIWHFRVSNLVGVVTDADAVVSFDTIFAANLIPIISPNARYEGCGLQRIRPGAATVEVFSVAGAGVGTLTGDSLPQQTAALVKIGNGLAGKVNRSYKYLPYPTELCNDAAGQLAGAYLTLISAFLNTLFPSAGIGGVGGTADCIPLMGARVGAPDATTKTTSINWAQQKRRGAHNRPDGTFPPP